MNKRRALLVGNSTFEDQANFINLQSPEKDVNAIAKSLSQFGDFEIFAILIDQESETIKTIIEDFYNKAEAGDLTLLYFSGHGYRSANGNLHVIAKNTRADRILSTGIGETFIKDAMKISKSHHRVTIFDCCFSGAFIANPKSGDDLIGFDVLKGEVDAVLASSGKNQFSFEEDGDYSLFTRFLIEGIESGQADQNQDGLIDIEELFNYCSQKVKQVRPEQTPVLSLLKRDSRIVVAKGIDLASINTLVVYHESPFENYISAWITAKLSLLGYKVLSVDQNFDKQLLSSQIAREVIKVFVIISRNTQFKSPFVDYLVSLAKNLVRENVLVSLLFTEEGSNNLENYPIGLPSITFSNNWAIGLQKLIDLVDQSGLRKEIISPEDVLLQWKAELAIKNQVQRGVEENYFSNWYSFIFPEYIYIHGISSYDDIKAKQNLIPVYYEGGHLITFACSDCCQDFASMYQSERIPIQDFLLGRDFLSPKKVSIKETNKKIIALLNESFAYFLKSKGMGEYQLSNSSIFYFTQKQKKEVVVKLNKFGRRSIQLSGKFRGFLWNFAIEANAFLYPINAYFLSYHAVFKTPQGDFLDKKSQHSLRRSIGRGWYNSALFTMTYGAISLLLGDNSTIEIKVDCKQSIEINPKPISFVSPASYIDPR